MTLREFMALTLAFDYRLRKNNYLAFELMQGVGWYFLKGIDHYVSAKYGKGWGAQYRVPHYGVAFYRADHISSTRCSDFSYFRTTFGLQLFKF